MNRLEERPRKIVELKFVDGSPWMNVDHLSKDSSSESVSFVPGASKSTSDAFDFRIDSFVNDSNNNLALAVPIRPNEVATTTTLECSATFSSPSSVLDELDRFVKDLKDLRVKRGFTQAQFSHMLAEVNPNVSQTTVSRFEALNLSFPNMMKLKPFFQFGMGLIQLDVPPDLPAELKRYKRNKRTLFSPAMRRTLEKVYAAHPEPISSQEYDVIVDSFQIEKRAIRNWFNNRRAADRKKEKGI